LFPVLAPTIYNQSHRLQRLFQLRPGSPIGASLRDDDADVKREKSRPRQAVVEESTSAARRG
jgi:hypothetical protein